MISLQKSGLMSVVRVVQIFTHPLKNIWRATFGFILTQVIVLGAGNEKK